MRSIPPVPFDLEAQEFAESICQRATERKWDWAARISKGLIDEKWESYVGKLSPVRKDGDTWIPCSQGLAPHGYVIILAPVTEEKGNA